VGRTHELRRRAAGPGEGPQLGDLLQGNAFCGSIVLSHLHWDHIQGIPFSPAVDHPDAQVRLHLPSEGDALETLTRGFSPPQFPISPDLLQGEWSFESITGGPVCEGVSAATVRHKGGSTVGIRVELDGAVLAYLPDHALDGEATDDARAFVEGADLLLHDGQMTLSEDDLARAYGHSAIERVLSFADSCQVGSLLLTHHAPTRTDDQLDALAAQFTRTPEGRPVSFARQGQVHDPC
jgi:ribonuclease BN (tRNA processing enzyme)